MKTNDLLKTTMLAFVVMLALVSVGFVRADNNSTDPVNTTLNQALNVRHDHLACKVDYSNTQLDLIQKYVTVDPAFDAAKTQLDADMTTLKTYLDAGNQTAFDAFVSTTLRKDIQDANSKAQDVKKNFKNYNITDDARARFRTDLKAAVANYNDCISDKEKKMSEVMLNHYENVESKWAKDTANLEAKNISTDDMNAVNAEFQTKLDTLKGLIDAGNWSGAKDYLETLRQDHLHFWARFEEGRLKGYIQKVEPLAEKYNQTQNIDDMKERLSEIENYTAPEYQFQEGDQDRVWDTLKNTTKELQNTNKELLKQQREQEREDRKDQQEEVKQQREQQREAAKQQQEEVEQQREQNKEANGNGSEPQGQGNGSNGSRSEE